MESDNVENISAWSVFQVTYFVSQFLHTEKYSKVLQMSQVDGKMLLNSKPDEWRKHGIQDLAHRAALYGWAQERIDVYQEKVSMQHHRISMESSNRAGNKNLEENANLETTPGSKLAKVNDEKKMPSKAILRESYRSQSRVLNDNMKDIRKWFANGVGCFSREEFVHGNLKKNQKLKDAIMEEIDIRKGELTLVRIDGKPYNWSRNEIFEIVQIQQNYQKKAKPISKKKQSTTSCEGNQDTNEVKEVAGMAKKENNHVIDLSKMEVADEEVYHVPMHANIGVAEQEIYHMNGEPQMGDFLHSNLGSTLEISFLSVTMYASPFFIPEQVIQFRQDRLAARGGVLEYKYFQEFDEGIIGIGSSKLLQRHSYGPYEMWELQVFDLAIGVPMSKLLLPSTHRAASTLCIGEVLKLPAVYLMMEVTIPKSITSSHAQDYQEKSFATSIPQECRTDGSNKTNGDSSNGCKIVGYKENSFATSIHEDKCRKDGSKSMEIVSCDTQRRSFDYATHKATQIYGSNCMKILWIHEGDSANEDDHNALDNKGGSDQMKGVWSHEGDSAHEDDHHALENKGGSDQMKGLWSHQGDSANEDDHHAHENKGGSDQMKGSETINAEGKSMSAMGHVGDWAADNLIPSLVCEYHAVDMDSKLARQAAQFIKDFTKKRVVIGDVVLEKEATNYNDVKEHEIEMEEIDTLDKRVKKKYSSVNSGLIQSLPKERANSRARNKSVKTKVLQDVTNSLLESPRGASTEDTLMTKKKGRFKRQLCKVAQIWQLSDFKNKWLSDANFVAGENIVDFEKLTIDDKEAIALKFLGQNDVDSMYGELPAHLRRIQSQYNVQFVGMKASTAKGMILDTIVSWALAMRKVYLMDSLVTQSDVYLF